MSEIYKHKTDPGFTFMFVCVVLPCFFVSVSLSYTLSVIFVYVSTKCKVYLSMKYY